MVFAMEELVRVGKIYFPTLDTLSEEFKNFRGVVDSDAKYRDIVAMMDAFNAWRRESIVWGCLDMTAIGKVDDLRVMWVARPGVDIGQACVSFQPLLLFRENIDLQYTFGSIEAIGVWPTPGANMFEAALAMRTASECLRRHVQLLDTSQGFQRS